MSETIRILVADDHPIVRDGLIAILGTQPDFEVVGKAGDGLEAVRLAEALQPDVLLLDLEMPELDGVGVLRRLRDTHSTIRAIVFTAFDTDERILSAVAAGVQGYLLKGAPREEIFTAIRVVYAGGSLLQPVVASKLLRRVSGENQHEPVTENLTPREQDVLNLLAQGLQNKEIAAELVITERTVKFYVSSILAKLGAGNRTEAVTIAVQRGLVKL
jgi:DNA-binding NarL/FixJ family response regulator